MNSTFHSSYHNSMTNPFREISRDKGIKKVVAPSALEKGFD